MTGGRYSRSISTPSISAKVSAELKHQVDQYATDRGLSKNDAVMELVEIALAHCGPIQRT